MTDLLPRGKIISDPYGIAATWFGVGLFPKMPGTFGSLAAMPWALLIHYFLGGWALLLAAIALFIAGIHISNVYMERFERTGDPKEVVIDEVAGQWLVLAIGGMEFYAYIFGFILFRLFDINKIWPVSWADQKIRGGLGVMLDDILAAIYAILVWQAVVYMGWNKYLLNLNV